jgi:hypothetical protein
MMGSRAHGGARIGARRWRHARASGGYRPAPRSASIRQPLQCAAEVLRNHSGSAHAVPTLSVTLAHVQETLYLLAAGRQRMAYAVADWCGEDGQHLDEDVAAPRHARCAGIGTTAEALRDSRAACFGERGSGHADCTQSHSPPTRPRCRRRHVTASRERSAGAAPRARPTATNPVIPATSRWLRGREMSNAPGAAVP